MSCLDIEWTERRKQIVHHGDDYVQRLINKEHKLKSGISIIKEINPIEMYNLPVGVYSRRCSPSDRRTIIRHLAEWSNALGLGPSPHPFESDSGDYQ